MVSDWCPCGALATLFDGRFGGFRGAAAGRMEGSSVNAFPNGISPNVERISQKDQV